MDLSMPIMDGYEAARKIRQFETKNKLKINELTYIVGLTAHSTEVYRTKTFEAGMNNFSKIIIYEILCLN